MADKKAKKLTDEEAERLEYPWKFEEKEKSKKAKKDK